MFVETSPVVAQIPLLIQFSRSTSAQVYSWFTIWHISFKKVNSVLFIVYVNQPSGGTNSFLIFSFLDQPQLSFIYDLQYGVSTFIEVNSVSFIASLWKPAQWWHKFLYSFSLLYQPQLSFIHDLQFDLSTFHFLGQPHHCRQGQLRHVNSNLQFIHLIAREAAKIGLFLFWSTVLFNAVHLRQTICSWKSGSIPQLCL